MKRKDEIAWDELLDSVNARDLEELTNRLGETFDTEIARQQLLPQIHVPSVLEVALTLGELEPTQTGFVQTHELTMTMNMPIIHKLLDAWTHYLDHDCGPSFEYLEEFLGVTFDQMGEYLFAGEGPANDTVELIECPDNEDDDWGVEGEDWWYDDDAE